MPGAGRVGTVPTAIQQLVARWRVVGGQDDINIVSALCTVCPRSLDPIHIVPYYMLTLYKIGKTSWTANMYFL